MPLVLVVTSRRTGHRASETDRVRLAQVRALCGSGGWGRGKSEGGRGEPQEMEDGGSPAHSCISLMNSQSVPWSKLNVMIRSSGFCGRVKIFLVSVLVEEEKEQLCGTKISSTIGWVSVAILVVSGGPIFAEGRLKK
ncbi:hypothetical protein GBAR_LOCUS28116 [Geodia barretti]|uniref:Uncharacterized protein n=1 Tax=Geodia barretti TaxID=519541 RepID=A0AA35XH63_GEOBA|nr:hypothetical protein GBAR_LOCUS28116 [Geodia barretti]